ncbi:S1 family peptidase [Mycobacterium sp.]|uniref:S1 family peptidase n=1 Tax=Mycobacterium sp. TaxID=1785 RepID=UPI003F95E002
MSTLLTGYGGTPHTIEVAEPVSKRRSLGTRVVAMAMHRVLVAVALALGLAGFLLSAPLAHADNRHAESAVAINEKVKHSLVEVWIEYTGWVQVPGDYFPDGQPEWFKAVAPFTCTGFVVDPSGLIATAGHCVDNTSEDTKAGIREEWVYSLVQQGKLPESAADALLQRANGQQWPVVGNDRGSPPERQVEVMQPDGPDRVIDQWTTVQVVQFQPANNGDNALLKVVESKPLEPLVVADKAPASGEPLTVVGFPGMMGRATDKSRLPQPSFTSGSVSGQQVSGTGVPVSEVNVNFMPGMSGGPAINSDGEVVGLVSQGYGTRGNNFITDAAGLRAFLLQNGVHLAQRPAPAESFPWIWVDSAAAAVVLLLPALTVPLVLRHRRKRRSTPAQPASAPAVQQSPTGSSQPPQEERRDVPTTTPAKAASVAAEGIPPTVNGAPMAIQ